MINLKTKGRIRKLENLMGGNLVSKDDAPILTPDATVDQYDATIVGTLAWNKAQIGTDRKEIKILPGTYKLLTSLILPENIYLDLDNGALIKPAAGVSLTVYSPEHIIAGDVQKIIDSTGNSTNPLMFTNAGTFPVNWWGVDDEAAQMAITEFGRVPGCHMKFVGAHAWNTGVKLTYANDSQIASKISGWGAKITSTLSSGRCLEFETGSYTTKLLTLDGLHFVCGGSEDGVVLFDADSDCTKFFFNVTVNNLFAGGFGGNGLEFEGCFFESRIYNSDFVAHSTNTTGDCIYFNGVTQFQSSLSMYECTTRGAKYGVHVATTREVYITGGTYILAQEEGIYINAARMTVINPHLEDNWAGGSSGAGMSFGGSGTIIGLTSQADTYDQFYGANIYIAAAAAYSTGTVQVVGGEWAPSDSTAFIRLTGQDTTTNLILVGNQTVDCIDGKSTVSRNSSEFYHEDVVTVTTGEDDLSSYTVGAYMMPKRSAMRVTSNGIKTGANGNKTIKFHVGDDAVEVFPAANNENAWQLDVMLYCIGATISVVWKLLDGAAFTQGHTAVTQDVSAAFDIKLTGECAHTDDTITQQNMFVEYL